MQAFLGIDTSNYTTSAALFFPEDGSVVQQKQLLTVRPGEKGLRQSDAVFQHVRSLPRQLEALFAQRQVQLAGVGVSAFPRRQQDSYMPCFLVGSGTAEAISLAGSCALHRFSHQEGHIAAALYSAGRLDLLRRGSFIAFHFSGGTTECVHCTAENGRLHLQLFAHTLDLNTGQAIDRVGLMLGLQFPCGPALEQLAAGTQKRWNIRPSFRDGNPSVSGLENKCAKLLADGVPPQEVAQYVQDYVLAVVDSISAAALAQYGTLPLLYAGGVMSNRYIAGEISRKYGGLFAQPQFSSDNAAGLAVLAAVKEQAI